MLLYDFLSNRQLLKMCLCLVYFIYHYSYFLFISNFRSFLSSCNLPVCTSLYRCRKSFIYPLIHHSTYLSIYSSVLFSLFFFLVFIYPFVHLFLLHVSFTLSSSHHIFLPGFSSAYHFLRAVIYFVFNFVFSIKHFDEKSFWHFSGVFFC